MRQPSHRGQVVPETDASPLGALAVAAVVPALLFTLSLPGVLAAALLGVAAGALAASAVRRVRETLRTRRRRRPRRVCLPGTRACIEL